MGKLGSLLDEGLDLLEGGKKPRLGSGERFAEIEKRAAASGAEDPAAVAAAAGIAKHGKAKMAKLAAAGKKRAAREG